MRVFSQHLYQCLGSESTVERRDHLQQLQQQYVLHQKRELTATTLLIPREYAAGFLPSKAVSVTRHRRVPTSYQAGGNCCQIDNTPIRWYIRGAVRLPPRTINHRCVVPRAPIERSKSSDDGGGKFPCACASSICRKRTTLST